MNEVARERVVVVGAGLAGSLISVFLAKRGFKVDLFERRADMRKEQVQAGRSINLNLTTRGIYALEQVGLAEPLLEESVKMAGRIMHSPQGDLTYSAYGKNESEVGHSISRAGLNIALLNAAESYDNVKLHFSHKCLGVDPDKAELGFLDETSNQTKNVSAAAIIAADGAGSAIRNSLAEVRGFELQQEFIEHGYKELCIPAGPDSTFLLDPGALHIWPRGSYMLIALPNLDKTFTCTLFLEEKGNPSFESLSNKERVIDFFKENFNDAYQLMPSLTEDFFSNPTGKLGTVKCFPWNIGKNTLLLGDAAHAIVPFYGQGMNCAFEDCTILDRCIDQHGPKWEDVFSAYQNERKADTDAIADLAMDNFVEMRDSVANPKFLLKRKLEHKLEEEFPDKFISKYSMVTFHRLPYSQAMKKGRLQDEILMEVCTDLDSIDGVDYRELLGRISSELHDKA